MALKIRLQRRGNRNRPVYKIVVAESYCRRDGKFVEALGNYDPQAKGQSHELTLSIERTNYWVGIGAKPSDTVKSLIKKATLAATVA